MTFIVAVWLDRLCSSGMLQASADICWQDFWLLNLCDCSGLCWPDNQDVILWEEKLICYFVVASEESYGTHPGWDLNQLVGQGCGFLF